MDKNKLTLELLGTYISGFKQGQTLEDTIGQINEQFFYPRHDDKDLLALARLMNPDYVITAQDRAEMAERRALSDQTRDQVFRLIHKRAEIMANTKMGRGLEMLLDFSDDPAAAKHNERVLYAFAMDGSGNYLHDVMDERTRIMEEFIDKMENEYDMTQYYGLSDKGIAGKLEGIFIAYLMGHEGGDSIIDRNYKGTGTQHYQLSEEYLQKLRNFRDHHQGQMTYVVSRLNMIIDPNYEIFHYERIMPDEAHMPSEVIGDTSNPFVQTMKKNFELDKFAYSIAQFDDTRGLTWGDMVQRHLEQHGVDVENAEVYDSDGKARNFKALYGLNGAGLLRVRDKSNGKEFLLQSNNVELLSVDPMEAPDILEKKTKDLVKAMDDADPWNIRLFTGSRAYAQMKAAMKSVAKMREEMPENPNETQRREFNQKLVELQDACEEYLKTKDPLTDTTKESERLRVNAANEANRYAKEMRILLSAHEKLVKERGTQEIQADAKKDDAPANREESGKNLEKKVFDFYWKRAEEGGPVGQLANDIIVGAGNIEVLPENPAGQLAKMVAFDLIMRERLINGGRQGGDIERAYNAQPQQFCKKLEQTQALQNAAGNMDAAGFQKLLDSAVSNKLHSLTNRALGEMMPRNEPQIKQEAPVATKQSGMVKG